jgi:hypothetical protein
VGERDILDTVVDDPRDAQVDHDTVVLLGQQERLHPDVAMDERRVLEIGRAQEQGLVMP